MSISDEKLTEVVEQSANETGEALAEGTNTNEELKDGESAKVDTQESVKTDYAKLAEEAWAKNIAEGTKTLEELQEKQPWLAERVTKRLGFMEQPSQGFDQKMQEYETQKNHQANKARLESLDTQLRNEIVREVNSLVDNKMPTPNALELVLRKRANDITNQSAKLQENRTSQKIPSGNPAVNQTVISYEQLSSLPQEDYNRTMKKVDAGEIKIN